MKDNKRSNMRIFLIGKVMPGIFAENSKGEEVNFHVFGFYVKNSVRFF